VVAKPKLRPLIPDSCLPFAGTATGSAFRLPISIVRLLQRAVGSVRRHAVSMFAGILPVPLAYQLDDVEYVLNKLFILHRSSAVDAREDIRVFSESLSILFVRLLELLDQVDQESNK
jgi:hypothetical protein